MPGKKRTILLTVADILNKSQEGAGAHNKYARMLWEVEATDSNACFKELVKCLSYMLTVPMHTNVNVERALRFIASFTAQVPHRDDSTCSLFIQDLIADLVVLSAAVDKVVRVRACSLLATIMQRLTTDLQDEALDELQEAMLQRLRDKVPQVRMHAAVVLERLAEPGGDGKFTHDPITRAYRKLLNGERNQDVRKCILGVMPVVRGATVEDLLERTLDISDAVRKQAFVVLANKCTMDNLAAPQRALLLQRGLRDRSKNVVDAARALVQTWLLEGCQSDVIKLLQMLVVQKYPEEAEEALTALAATKNLQLKEIACDAEANSKGLRSPQGSALLSTEEAFFWRWTCEWLKEEGDSKGQAAAATRGAEASVEAAAASDSLQALEAALPGSVAGLMDLVAAHAAAGSTHGYAVSQLLRIATTCIDLTDASGRKAAADLLHDLLRQPGWARKDGAAWECALSQLAEQVHSAGAAELQMCLTDAITDVQARCLSDSGTDQQDDWCQALSLASMLLQHVPSFSSPMQQNVPALLDSLIYPGLCQKSVTVRVVAVRCLGLYALLSTAGMSVGSEAKMEHKLPISLLRAALDDTQHAVRLQAARALCDLVLARGPKTVDACHTYLVLHPQEYLPHTADTAAIAVAVEKATANAQPVLDLLLLKLAGLSSTGEEAQNEANERQELGSVVSEGLAKLVMHQSRWRADALCRMEDSHIAQVLVRLLVANVDPATELATSARQCLSVFFPAYAGFSGWHHHLLGEATLPAARRSLALGPSLAKSAAPNLLRFILQLLQTPVAEREGGKDYGYSLLAQRCLAEILACAHNTAAKPYTAALLHLVAGLPLQAASLDAIKTLRVLAEQVKAAVSGVTAGRDAASLCRRLVALDTSPSEVLSEEAVAEVLKRAQESTQGSEALFPQTSAASSRTPTRHRRTARRPAVIDKDTSDDSELEDRDQEGQEAQAGLEAESASENQAGEQREVRKVAGKVRQAGKRKALSARGALQENMISPTL